VRALLRRVDDEGPYAFVAGWRIRPSVERAAFQHGLLVDVDPDLWTVTDAGRRVIGRVAVNPPCLD
jgi:hypothetical protein